MPVPDHGDAGVVREFDLDTLSFVDGGFCLPEAKSAITWIDRDTVYVGFGDLTSSGYPRTVREWRRGTPLDEATLEGLRAVYDDAVREHVHDRW